MSKFSKVLISYINYELRKEILKKIKDYMCLPSFFSLEGQTPAIAQVAQSFSKMAAVSISH